MPYRTNEIAAHDVLWSSWWAFSSQGNEPGWRRRMRFGSRGHPWVHHPSWSCHHQHCWRLHQPYRDLSSLFDHGNYMLASWMFRTHLEISKATLVTRHASKLSLTFPSKRNSVIRGPWEFSGVGLITRIRRHPWTCLNVPLIFWRAHTCLQS